MLAMESEVVRMSGFVRAAEVDHGDQDHDDERDSGGDSAAAIIHVAEPGGGADGGEREDKEHVEKRLKSAAGGNAGADGAGDGSQM